MDYECFKEEEEGDETQLLHQMKFTALMLLHLSNYMQHYDKFA